jgi:flagellar biosynthesis/type III secretory pathway chaperone
MRTMRVFIIGAAMLACTVIGIAQTSEPTPPLTIPTQPTPAPADAAKEQAEQAELAADIKELQELNAQNNEILKDQQAALDVLEQLEKDADQLRIYSKRG